ncbi:MAG: UDP-2,3-diacylglucosamine diphosphatase [Oceanospirillaceae bacterium]|nr:UDP-2,3-diacylglucosamine diphosphatase [Oceanospirillaceae bacterium]
MRHLFIADLHLQPERPEISRAFHYLLDHIVTPSDHLYLMGDIFEYWIGDDAPLPGLDSLFDKLRALNDRGCRLFFQHGNRDFLVGQSLLEQWGATLLPEVTVINLPEEPAVVLHGDQLCLDDREYQQFRTLVRDPDWQAQFLAQPIEARIETARQMRAESSARGSMTADAISDVSPDAVRRTLQESNANLMIHGHTHRPDVHHDQIGPGQGTRIVLGDWSSDGWYLLIDETGGRSLTRFTPPASYSPA